MKLEKLILSLFLRFFFNLSILLALDSERELFVKIEDENGTITNKDLIEYIEEGSNYIISKTESEIQQNAVMVLGLTGTGKTTVINYLNDVPLVSTKKDGKWIIDLEIGASSLPGGFKIGHTTKSETQYPSVYTPPGQNFTYVDNPGFQDNRGIEIEIANNFFRQEVLQKINKIKFLLLITHPDLELRAQQFRETIKRFSEIFGIFDQDVKTLSKSIAIVVTRVDNDGETDSDMKEYLREKLLDVLSEEKKAGNLSPNEEKVFKEIIQNKQVEIFSNPKKKVKLDTIQSKQIINAINRLTFFSKSDLMFRLKILPSYVLTLYRYTQNHYEIFIKYVNDYISKSTKDYISEEINNALTTEDLSKIQVKIEDFQRFGSLKNNFTAFMNNISVDILDSNSKKNISLKKNVLDFFIQLLPEEFQVQYLSEKNYFNEFQLENFLNDNVNYLKQLKYRETKVENGILRIKGCFIKSSEMNVEIRRYKESITIVAVFACHAVHFDEYLNLIGFKSVTVIAPNWKIEKNIIIDLSGISANNFNNVASIGVDGIPGTPGQNGGTFYGFADKYIDLENLSIKLNGGAGGAAQHGGNGAEPSTLLDGSQCIIPNPSNFYEYTKDESGGGVTRTRKFWSAYGSEPSQGYNGGRGGKGGVGGNPGIAYLFKSSEKSTFEFILNIRGTPGISGQDGNSGIGKQGGCKYKCTRSHMYKKWRSWNPFKGYETTEYWVDDLVNNCVSRGKPGVTPTEKNSIGQQFPISIFQTENNPTILLLHYQVEQLISKNFNLNQSFHKNLRNLVILDNLSISQIIEILLEETKVLDAYLEKYSDKIDFIPYYQSLILKARRTQETYTLGAIDTLHNNTLNFLISYGLSRINQLNAKENRILVINLREYLKTLIKNFDLLQSFKATELREMYTKSYNELIENKIVEANEILKLLQNNIQDEHKNVKQELIQLQSEIDASINSAIKDLNALEQKKRELQKAKQKNVLFGILRVASIGIGLLYPSVGPVVSSVIMAGLKVTNEPTLDSIIQFSESVGQFSGKISELNENIFKKEIITNQSTKLKTSIAKIKNLAKTLEPVVRDVKSLIKVQQSSSSEIANVDNAINALIARINELEIYRVEIPTTVGFYLDDVIDTVSTYQTSFKGRSISELNYFKIELNDFFSKVTSTLEIILGQFDNSIGNFKNIIQTLKQSIDVSTTIYSKIQDYCDHIAFANYISNLQSSSSFDLNYGKFQSDVLFLKTSIQFNTVNEMYTKSIMTVEQTMFPFAIQIISDCRPLVGSLDNKMVVMKQNLINIQHRIETYFSSIEKFDEAIIKMKFTKLTPFYSWTCDTWNNEIIALFKGQKVKLNTNITQVRKSAVKFNKIDIKIDSDQNTNISKIIKDNYKVTLRHMGYSFFKYGNSYFKTSNDQPFLLIFSFKRNSNDVPVIRNEVYDKMMNGELLASPYTSWIMQLEPIDGKQFTLNSTNLQTGCDIKISLVGEGSYVNEDLVTKELNLNEYYREIDSTF